jgi:hypothetical protein
MRSDSLMAGNFELHSVLSGQFISYANLVRLNLEAAARMAKISAEAPGETLADIIAESDRAEEAKAKAAEKGESPDQDQGDEEIAPPGASQLAMVAKDGPSGDDQDAQDDDSIFYDPTKP